MPHPERGDIYHIDVPKSEIVGHEFYGPHWWVVLSIGQLNRDLKVFTAIPLNSLHNKQTKRPKDEGDFRFFRIRILAVSKKPDQGQQHADVFHDESIALPESIRHFSVDRITGPRVGTVDQVGLGAIEAGLLFMMGAGIRRQPVNLQDSPADEKAKVTLPAEPAKPVPGKPKTG